MFTFNVLGAALQCLRRSSMSYVDFGHSIGDIAPAHERSEVVVGPTRPADVLHSECPE